MTFDEGVKRHFARSWPEQAQAISIATWGELCLFCEKSRVGDESAFEYVGQLCFSCGTQFKAGLRAGLYAKKKG